MLRFILDKCYLNFYSYYHHLLVMGIQYCWPHDLDFKYPFRTENSESECYLYMFKHIYSKYHPLDLVNFFFPSQYYFILNSVKEVVFFEKLRYSQIFRPAVARRKSIYTRFWWLVNLALVKHPSLNVTFISFSHNITELRLVSTLPWRSSTGMPRPSCDFSYGILPVRLFVMTLYWTLWNFTSIVYS